MFFVIVVSIRNICARKSSIRQARMNADASVYLRVFVTENETLPTLVKSQWRPPSTDELNKHRHWHRVTRFFRGSHVLPLPRLLTGGKAGACKSLRKRILTVCNTVFFYRRAFVTLNKNEIRQTTQIRNIHPPIERFETAHENILHFSALLL